ncbi:type I restriction endonuclease subunit R [Thermosynechococcus vestitus]|uniref:Type I restriction enzyme endonuclease subunit n=1 Tax=Thermosynechococcus vestitus (strain NIES-2133 / IAM M-273 / BP-1) TaxID=197221 RepID=Q8DGT3_THEVB|nr:type I restriction endonuclease subunit R [Thermosynechococcus vestitus]BAC09782.1 type I site-specific deoxyribonuclease endonuclease [Thermosynechococcus vestitus BP-1]
MSKTTEQQIEELLIEKLQCLGYTYRPDIRDREALERNFRAKFEALNHVKLTDTEFARLLDQIVSPDVFACSERLRHRNTFEREDGTPLHYQLVNLKDWCKNEFELVNQLRINTRSSFHRYDVILLVNGLPLVQIELKALPVSPRRAMQQIIEYKQDPGNGYAKTLLCFMQLFIVSNRSLTWYFANNNAEHFRFDADERFLPIYQWATPGNEKVAHLDDFAEAFLTKCTLVEMISRYMVLIQTERKLMMMRPYQIYAVKAIVDCIHENRGNGYIWHTTGSGKTLTSFKASTLLKDNPDIAKVLFVVDRKDLDRQTRQEFNRFQPGCVEENTNTETLVRRLLSDDYADKVIVTTIQKLGLALDANHRKEYRKQLEALRDKRIVFIFDECHRSQFGENHKAIREFFPRAQLFGFTGTPIFEQNATYRTIEGQEARMVTTADVFGKQLHAYTITHAIDDKNVLRFHVEYYKPEGAPVKPGETLAKQKVVEAILEKHDQATNQRRFNALFATASIDDAIEYYHLFKEIQAKRQAEDENFQPLNVACVFSPPADGNRDIAQLQEDLPQELADNRKEPNKKKEALAAIIADYNARYGTNFDLATFDGYYQDIQQRIKDHKYPNRDLPHEKKIDLTIVVDMLLTGFDSQYLNTLYVDKNLKHHGLIQAFSRTNRVLNDTKPYGNILDFRAQRAAVDEAITLFSGEAGERAREIWLVDPAPVVADRFAKAVQALEAFMQSQGLECKPEEVANLKGDEARAAFIERFKEVQRLRTQLDQYTDLDPATREAIEQALPEDTLRAFRGVYLDLAQDLKARQGKSADPNNPVEQLDFEFVLFDSALIDYDYIMKLIARFSEKGPKKQKMTREQLVGILRSNAKFLDEREEIIEYVNTLKEGEGLSEQQIRAGYERFKAEKYARAVAEIAARHNLAPEALQGFIDGILHRMIFNSDALTELLKPLGLGWKVRAKKELALMEDLTPLLRKLAQGKEISGLEVYDHA